MSKTPVGFMSYAHVDNKTGRLTEFCERLSDEVHQLTGEAFPIFQDKKDVLWGQSWRERIDESLDSATFLIPILTPSFFKSSECRKELEQFLELEQQLGRKDLILPVYYIDYAVLNDEKKRALDPLAQAIFTRQHADWRDLRHGPYTAPETAQKLEWLGKQVLAALERVASPPALVQPDPTTSTVAETQLMSTKPPSATQAGIKPSQTATRNEPQLLVVDPLHRGDYASITEAINAAKPGARILIRAGLYEEGLVIDKPLEIIGDSSSEEVEVRASDRNTILFKTTFGRITNLKLRQVGDKHYCVAIAQGRLELEDCDISGQGLACVAIHDGADPRLRRNRIHNGRRGGVYIYEKGLGTLEENDIFAHALAGVEIKGDGDPTLRRNRIYEGKTAGVLVHSKGRGTLEDNNIFTNGMANVAIREEGNPILRRNRIHDGKQAGVLVHSKGLGTLEDNDIFANAFAGVTIQEESNPVLRGNRIHDGKTTGVLVQTKGLGMLEENDIFANALANVEIKDEGDPTIRRNRIHDGKQAGVFVHSKGLGTLEENDIFANALTGVGIKKDGDPMLRLNRIHDGKQSGVFVYERGRGTLEKNDIFANASTGVTIQEEGNPILRGNRIHKNGYEAVWVLKSGRGTIEDNDLRENARGAWDISEDSKAKVNRARNLE